MSRFSVIGVFVTVLMGLLVSAGCNERSDVPEVTTAEGEAESIDVASGQVSMRMYSPKKQRYIKRSGVVNDQTEILINGVSSRLEDIRLGEKVKVTGRITKDGASGQIVATRIEVTRESPAASQPASGPVTKVGEAG